MPAPGTQGNLALMGSFQAVARDSITGSYLPFVSVNFHSPEGLARRALSCLLCLPAENRGPEWENDQSRSGAGLAWCQSAGHQVLSICSSSPKAFASKVKGQGSPEIYSSISDRKLPRGLLLLLRSHIFCLGGTIYGKVPRPV